MPCIPIHLTQRKGVNLMSGTLQVTLLRKREFYIRWLDRTETDYVCMRCGTIAVDGKTCQHCAREQAKKRESLQRFLEKKAREKEES